LQQGQHVAQSFLYERLSRQPGIEHAVLRSARKREKSLANSFMKSVVLALDSIACDVTLA
jgi:hypothetical protein